MRFLIIAILFPALLFAQDSSKGTFSMTTLKQLGLTLRGTAPANSTQQVTKDRLNQYFYFDNSQGTIGTKSGNQLLTNEVFAKANFTQPVKAFYQFDVTRSGIPGATGAYFNFINTQFQSQQVLQNTYGYVGRFCMQDGSYMNNQYNVYSFTYVGVCYPNFGTTYPQPFISGGALSFNSVSGYNVTDVVINRVNMYNTFYDDPGWLPSFRETVQSLWAIIKTFATLTNQFGDKVTLQTVFTGTGTYSNGSLSFSSFPANGTELTTQLTTTNQYYISYKVTNNFGFVVYTYGFGGGANSQPPYVTN